MDSDLSDIQKIQNVLCGATKDNESSVVEYNIRCDSADGYSIASSYQQHLTPQPENSFSIFEELSSDSLDEDRLVINQLEPSLENALCLNKAYQSMLIELSQQLDVLRIVNQQKQKAVQEEIEMLTTQVNKKPDKQKKKKITFSFFGMPYFKDAQYNCPPKNEDTQLAESIGFRNIAAISVHRPFSKYEIRWLRKALKEQALTIEANRLLKLREELQNQLALNHALSDDEKKAIGNQIDIVQRQIYDVNSLPEEKLCDLSPTMFDWQKIAIENFLRSRTPDQLKQHWLHYLRPGVNRRPWLAAENNKLKELVKKYENGIDWEELAVNLNTNRTAFECFRRYQERFGEHRKFGWTKEDNLYLIKLICNGYGDKTFREIDWEEIRHNFPGRSKTQIYAHFKYHSYCVDQTPFTVSEDTVILEGIKMGYGINDISLLLGKRSSMQIRNRYNHITGKGKNKSKEELEKPWTEKENKLLLAMKETSQLRKQVMRKDFPGRTFAQLFSRFHYLRMKRTTPKQYIEELKDKLQFSRKSLLPKETANKNIANKIAAMMSECNYDKEAKNSLRKTLPMLKKDWLAPGKPENLKLNPLLIKNVSSKPLKCKRLMEKREKQLKEILRPLMSITKKRPRKVSFPGDGREHGIILTSLYRLLQCYFTKAPKEEPSEEEMDALGIAPQDYLSFVNLLSLTKDTARPNIAAAPETILCLPPNLNSLTGFRGLLLHRKYLQSSASCEYSPPEKRYNHATITEVTEEMTTGCNGQTAMETDVEIETLQNDQQERNAVAENNIVEPTAVIDSSQTASDLQENSDEVITSETSMALQNVVSSASTPDSAANQSHLCDESMPEQAERNNTEDTTAETGNGDYIEVTSVQSSPLGSEDENEDEEQVFGDRKADSLLLSRLLTLFYWPGIMSTLHVPDKLKQNQPDKVPDDDQMDESTEEQPAPSKSPVPIQRILTKKETKERRRAHILAVVRKRFGKSNPEDENSGEAGASTSAGPAEVNMEVATPPPAKKTKVGSNKGKKKTPRTVPPSDRITRTRKK